MDALTFSIREINKVIRDDYIDDDDDDIAFNPYNVESRSDDTDADLDTDEDDDEVHWTSFQVIGCYTFGR